MPLYKTWDRFSSIDFLRPASGFAAEPPGAVARMINISSAGLVQGGLARLLIVWRDNTAGQDLHASWRLNETDWHDHSFAGAGISNENWGKAHALTASLWFVIKYQHRDNMVTSAHRTASAGAIWNVVAEPAANHKWQAFAIDISGRVWGVTTTVATAPITVWYSDSSGADGSWVQAFNRDDAGGYFPGGIVCHPGVDDILAVYGWDFNSDEVWVASSADRGDSWTFNAVAPPGTTGQLNKRHDVVMLPSGRLVTTMTTPSGATYQDNIVTSDDFGATWTTRLTAANDHSSDDTTEGTHMAGVFGGNGKLFHVECGMNGSPFLTDVLMSTDDGETWEYLIPFPRNAEDDSTGRRGGAYDVLTDTLYVFLSSLNAENVDVIQKMHPVFNGGPWVDITSTPWPPDGNASMATGDLIDSSTSNSIAAIPW